MKGSTQAFNAKGETLIWRYPIFAFFSVWLLIAAIASADPAASQVRIHSTAAAQKRANPANSRQDLPNIVLIFPDNIGIGELDIYGGNRFVPTPRIDSLAAEGMWFTNFNVEYFCIASRAALLTGRHSIRSGANGYRPQKPGAPHFFHGLTQWEITLAELLAPLGYTSANFGKWHLGDTEGRYPTDQGFDEWYGIPLSSNEAEQSTTGETPYIWEGKAGSLFLEFLQRVQSGFGFGGLSPGGVKSRQQSAGVGILRFPFDDRAQDPHCAPAVTTLFVNRIKERGSMDAVLPMSSRH